MTLNYNDVPTTLRNDASSFFITFVVYIIRQFVVVVVVVGAIVPLLFERIQTLSGIRKLHRARPANRKFG